MQIRISTESWHYKMLYNFSGYRRSVPRNLCDYFWKAIGVMVFFAGMTCVLSFLGVMLLIIYLSPILTFLIPWIAGVPVGDATFHGYMSNASRDFISIGGPQWIWLLWFAPSIALHLFVVIIVIANVRTSETPLTDMLPFAGVVKEYVSAVKNRWCPLIEFVDPERAQAAGVVQDD